jgi:hypothetical protein
MAGTPAEPPPKGSGTAPQADAAASQAQPVERYGTVAIARHRKGDGRALILYAHADAESP